MLSLNKYRKIFPKYCVIACKSNAKKKKTFENKIFRIPFASIQDWI